MGTNARRRGLGVGKLMAADMDRRDDAKRGDPARPLWGELPAETRAEYINKEVEKVIEESKAATKKIVEEAVKEFAEDYAEIKSKSMRVSVLRNISEDPQPVDPQESDDRVDPHQGPLPPPPEQRSRMQRGPFASIFLHILGFFGVMS